VRLVAAGVVTDAAEGLHRAEAVLDDGRASAVLDALAG
jgi:anthranilate phosphoribosyltransferase